LSGKGVETPKTKRERIGNKDVSKGCLLELGGRAIVRLDFTKTAFSAALDLIQQGSTTTRTTTTATRGNRRRRGRCRRSNGRWWGWRNPSSALTKTLTVLSSLLKKQEKKRYLKN